MVKVASRPTPQLVLSHCQPRLCSRRGRADGQQILTLPLHGRKQEKQMFHIRELPSWPGTLLRAVTLVLLVFPTDILTVETRTLQVQACNYAIMSFKQRKVRGQDHEPLAGRFACEERRAVLLSKTLPRSGTPQSLYNRA